MSDERKEHDLAAENAALRQQKLQLEQQLSSERLRKQRSWTRQCFICAIVLTFLAVLVNEIRVPFGGKLAGTDTAAMVLGWLAAALFVAGVFSASKEQPK